MTKNKLYEAMFLVDSADAGSDWDGVIAAITKILERAEVEIVSMRKWDDRRLAYDIKGKSRGTYLLCYFRSDGQMNQEIEKAVQISERIIRVLILSVDWMTAEDIEKDTPSTKAEKEKEDREASKEAAEAETEATKQAEPSEEPAPAEEPVTVETIASADEAAPAEEAVEAQATEATPEPEAAATPEPEVSPTPEPAKEETDDSQEAQPKVAADE
jgi:small subunit ribosomal protein S6